MSKEHEEELKRFRGAATLFKRIARRLRMRAETIKNEEADYTFRQIEILSDNYIQKVGEGSTEDIVEVLKDEICSTLTLVELLKKCSTSVTACKMILGISEEKPERKLEEKEDLDKEVETAYMLEAVRERKYGYKSLQGQFVWEVLGIPDKKAAKMITDLLNAIDRYSTITEVINYIKEKYESENERIQAYMMLGRILLLMYEPLSEIYEMKKQLFLYFARKRKERLERTPPTTI